MPLPEIETLTAPKRGVHFKGKPKFNLLGFVYLPFAIVVALLVLYGLMVCYSAVQGNPDYNFNRQMLGVALGLIVMALFWGFDYRKFANLHYIFLIISVVLILLPLLPGIGTDAGMGARSWIRIGIQLQPAEFAKVTVVLFSASLLARYGGKLDNLSEYIKVIGLMLIPFVCIMLQPDLGTGLVYLFISGIVMIMGGARVKYLVVTLVIGVAAIAAVFAIDELLKYETANGNTEYRLLKQYQRARLFVFLNQDSLGDTDDGYNLQQAMIAIGSGGLFGKGFGSATQSSLGFLPEAPTDFIFCVLAEEFGFIGVIALIALYGLMIFFSIKIAKSCNNLFGMLIICAIIGMWLFQILENIGMCLGLMPITGIPLPFVSYGSSFMIVNFAMLGLISSVYYHETMLGKALKYANAN